MSRTSPFAMALSCTEERGHCERSRQYTAPYCNVIRAKIILLAASRHGTRAGPAAAGRARGRMPS